MKYSFLELLLLKFAERLVDFGLPEMLPKLEGKRMMMIFAPKGKKKGGLYPSYD